MKMPGIALRLKAILACYAVVQISGLLIGIAVYLLTGQVFGGSIRISEVGSGVIGYGLLFGFIYTAAPTAIYAVVLGLMAYAFATRVHAYKTIMIIGAVLTLICFFTVLAISETISVFDRDDYDPQLISMIYSSLIAGALGGSSAVWICRRAR